MSWTSVGWFVAVFAVGFLMGNLKEKRAEKARVASLETLDVIEVSFERLKERNPAIASSLLAKVEERIGRLKVEGKRSKVDKHDLNCLSYDIDKLHDKGYLEHDSQYDM